MSELRTNRIVPRDGLTSGTFGGIIQVVQTVKQTYQTININSEDDYGYVKLFEGSSEITGASGNTATGNRINALASISNRGAGDDRFFVNHLSGTYIHAPSSTSPTIKMKGKCTYGSTIHVNGIAQDDNTLYNIRTASFLHLYELAG